MNNKTNIINLNHTIIRLEDFPYGKTQDLIVKVGRKLYYMDINKDKLFATVDIYNYCGERSSFSKYGSKADMHFIYLEPVGLIDRDLFEHAAEIEKAQTLLTKYKYPHRVQ